MLLWAAAAWALELLGRRGRPHGRYDAIVVPGCRLLPGGGASGAHLRRVDRAVELWREGRAALLLLTGGPRGRRPSEAEMAARYARSQGVPESALLLEEESSSTAGNARCAARLIEARRVLLVTDSYHVPRARRLFGRYFEHVEVAPVQGPFASRFRNALREVLALVYNLLLGRL